MGIALHQVITFLVDGAKASPFDLQYQVGHISHLGRIPIIGIENTNQISRRRLPFLTIEITFYFGPGEKIGMDYLVRITA